MSTNVNREEWPNLKPVPVANYSWKTKDGWQPNTLGPCDANKDHGRGHFFYQTADGRAIVLCGDCNRELAAENPEATEAHAAAFA